MTLWWRRCNATAILHVNYTYVSQCILIQNLMRMYIHMHICIILYVYIIIPLEPFRYTKYTSVLHVISPCTTTSGWSLSVRILHHFSCPVWHWITSQHLGYQHILNVLGRPLCAMKHREAICWDVSTTLTHFRSVCAADPNDWYMSRSIHICNRLVNWFWICPYLKEKTHLASFSPDANSFFLKFQQ